MHKEMIQKIRDFGLVISLYDFIFKIVRKLFPETNLYYNVAEKKHNLIKNKLLKKYHYIVENFEYNIPLTTPAKIIWVFWWQGIENAPLLVRKCVESIEKNYTDYSVTILCKDNIYEYIQFPPDLEEKVKSNIITLTHLSDIVRMKLLNEYGGIWMDATIFVSDPIDIDKPFITLHLPKTKNRDMVSKGKWCGFFLGGSPNCLFSFVNVFFEEYWKKENSLIDYFLIDYVIRLGYDNLPEIKELIDGVPENQKEVFALQNMLGTAYSEEILNDLFLKNNIHKLSYKEKLEAAVNGTITVFGKIMED